MTYKFLKAPNAKDNKFSVNKKLLENGRIDRVAKASFNFLYTEIFISRY